MDCCLRNKVHIAVPALLFTFCTYEIFVRQLGTAFAGNLVHASPCRWPDFAEDGSPSAVDAPAAPPIHVLVAADPWKPPRSALTAWLEHLRGRPDALAALPSVVHQRQPDLALLHGEGWDGPGGPLRWRVLQRSATRAGAGAFLHPLAAPTPESPVTGSPHNSTAAGSRHNSTTAAPPRNITVAGVEFLLVDSGAIFPEEQAENATLAPAVEPAGSTAASADAAAPAGSGGGGGGRRRLQMQEQPGYQGERQPKGSKQQRWGKKRPHGAHLARKDRQPPGMGWRSMRKRGYKACPGAGKDAKHFSQKWCHKIIERARDRQTDTLIAASTYEGWRAPCQSSNCRRLQMAPGAEGAVRVVVSDLPLHRAGGLPCSAGPGPGPAPAAGEELPPEYSAHPWPGEEPPAREALPPDYSAALLRARPAAVLSTRARGRCDAVHPEDALAGTPAVPEYTVAARSGPDGLVSFALVAIEAGSGRVRVEHCTLPSPTRVSLLSHLACNLLIAALALLGVLLHKYRQAACLALRRDASAVVDIKSLRETVSLEEVSEY